MVVDPFRFRVSPDIEFSDSQLETFKAILDTFVAPLPQEQEDALVVKLQDTHSEEEVRSFSKMSGTSIQSLETVREFINHCVLAEKRQELLLMLSLLSSRAGTFALSGYFDEFKNLGLEDREKIFVNWKNSYIPQLRLLYKTFHSLSCHPTYAGHSKELGDAMHYNNMASKTAVYENIPERLTMLPLDQVHDDMAFDVVVIGSGAGGGK